MDGQSCLEKHASPRRAANNMVTLLLIVTVMFLLVGAVTSSSSSFPNSPANVVNMDSEYNINFSSVTVRRMGNSRYDGVASRRSMHPLDQPCYSNPTGPTQCTKPCDEQTEQSFGTCPPGV